MNDHEPDINTIEAMAEAGFRMYHTARPGWTWETVAFPVAERWRVVATQVLYGQLATPPALRTAYTDGMEASPWTGPNSRQGHIWRRVWDAMVEAIQRAAKAGEEAA